MYVCCFTHSSKYVFWLVLLLLQWNYFLDRGAYTCTALSRYLYRGATTYLYRGGPWIVDERWMVLWTFYSLNRQYVTSGLLYVILIIITMITTLIMIIVMVILIILMILTIMTISMMIMMILMMIMMIMGG